MVLSQTHETEMLHFWKLLLMHMLLPLLYPVDIMKRGNLHLNIVTSA